MKDRAVSAKSLCSRPLVLHIWVWIDGDTPFWLCNFVSSSKVFWEYRTCDSLHFPTWGGRILPLTCLYSWHIGSEMLGEWGIIESARGLRWKNYSISRQNTGFFLLCCLLYCIVYWLCWFTILIIECKSEIIYYEMYLKPGN